MKKITMIAAVAVLALSFTSCKKERVCECVFSSTNPNQTSTTEKVTYKKAKKGICDEKSVSSVTTAPAAPTGVTYYTYTETCTLK
jgi:hypothetical protein